MQGWHVVELVHNRLLLPLKLLEEQDDCNVRRLMHRCCTSSDDARRITPSITRVRCVSRPRARQESCCLPKLYQDWQRRPKRRQRGPGFRSQRRHQTFQPQLAPTSRSSTSAHATIRCCIPYHAACHVIQRLYHHLHPCWRLCKSVLIYLCKAVR